MRNQVLLASILLLANTKRCKLFIFFIFLRVDQPWNIVVCCQYKMWKKNCSVLCFLFLLSLLKSHISVSNPNADNMNIQGKTNPRGGNMKIQGETIWKSKGRQIQGEKIRNEQKWLKLFKDLHSLKWKAKSPIRIVLQGFLIPKS